MSCVAAADAVLRDCPLLGRIRYRPATVWAMSSFSLFVDTFVYSLTVAMLPEMLQNKMKAPESANGLVTSVFGLGSIVSCLAAGYASDKIRNRRTIQVLASLVYVVAGGIFFVAGHFYQILLFRLVNGVASGVACTLSFTSMADVYPANLLGLKTAVVYLFNDAAYTIGPLCGERLYHMGGVRSPASVAIALGLLRFVVYLVAADDSLVIRDRQSLLLLPLPPAHTPSQADTSSEAGSSSMDKGQYHASGDCLDAVKEDYADSSMSMWRLLRSPDVIIATLSIATGLGVQCMLEALVPLHLIDSLHRPDDNGITFVILGLTFTVLVSPVGKATDVLIARSGEVMRHYMMLAGAGVMVLAAVVMSVAGSYAVLMTGFSVFALANLCMIIPALSAYGDFVNGANTNSMGRGYAISGCAWATGIAVMPAIGSALYARFGFTVPVVGVTLAMCAASAAGFLAFIIRDWIQRSGQTRHGSSPSEQPCEKST
ncbi:hypothetical protein H4R19_004437 [Coemansia spiralis]|nr:hypothetical protein H4R19_004437 [Coemansia spiralis]